MVQGCFLVVVRTNAIGMMYLTKFLWHGVTAAVKFGVQIRSKKIINLPNKVAGSSLLISFLNIIIEVATLLKKARRRIHNGGDNLQVHVDLIFFLKKYLYQFILLSYFY